MLGIDSTLNFLPIQALELRAGNLYSLVMSLMVSVSFAYTAWLIFFKKSKGPLDNIFASFLAVVSLFWMFSGMASLFGWLSYPSSWIAYPAKALSAAGAAILFYFLCRELFNRSFAGWILVSLYSIIAAVFLFSTFRVDGARVLTAYWGVTWPLNGIAARLFQFGLLLPLLLGACYLMAKAYQRKADTHDYAIHLAAIIYAILENVKFNTGAEWSGLIVRLFYLLIPLGAYIYFIGRAERVKFGGQEENIPAAKQMRFSFFTRMLFYFIFTSLIPIAAASLLMYASFREIISLYVEKPLLFNLKGTREAFLLSLSYLQMEALVILIIILFLVLVAAILISRSIAHSLQQISKGMEKVSRGDFSFKLLTRGNDEISDMANYFNRMAGEIRRAREVMENLNLWLESKVRERTEELRILFDVTKTIGSTMDLELLVSRAIELLRPILRAEIYLLMVSDEKGVFKARAGGGCDLSKITPAPIGRGAGLLDESVREGKIVYCDRNSSEARCHDELFRILGARTLMATPLRSKGQTVGILIVGTLAEHRYSEEREGNLLSTIADQLAIAIENIFVLEKEKEAVARLTELDRLKSEFISMVSHELRTPVTSADGYISLFLAGVAGPLSEDQKKYLTIVRENNQRLLSIINRLLDFSKIETGRFKIQRELISINEVINAAVESMREQIEKKQALVKLHLEAKNINFMGDREKMKEVFINLIENALKFGRIEENPSIAIQTKDAGDYLDVMVEDNGVGIEKEYLDKIFNKFFQVEETLTRNVGGLGLGLALVKEIIGDHHGSIRAESEGKGKGARFIFELPLAEKA